MNIEENKKNFCDNICHIRKKFGFSITKMSKKLHITTNSLKLIEKGIIPQRLSSEILFHIFEEFHIHPKEMLDSSLKIK